MRTALLALALLTPAGRPAPIYIVDAWKSRGQTGVGLWRPTMQQAIGAREALRAYLHSSAVASLSSWQQGAARHVAANLDQYVFQAEGVRAPGKNQTFGTESGPRQIHLDGICGPVANEMGSRVRTQMILVFDGGTCFFQAMYDLQSRSITMFSSNGYA